MKTIFFKHMLMTILFAAGLTQTVETFVQENLQHEQEIRKLLDEFAQAFAKTDTVVLKKLVADDYIHTNLDGGVLNKSQWLERAKMRLAEIDAGKFKITHYSYDDIRIRIYGNTAVATGLAKTEGLREGKEFKWNLRFTNVWVKRDGLWQRVAFHDSSLRQG